MNSAQHYRKWIAHKHLTATQKGWLCYAAYRQGDSTATIAARYGISESRVRQLCKDIGRPLSKVGQGVG